MSMEVCFSLVNISVLPAWALLVFAPKARLTHTLVHSWAYPMVLGCVYMAGLIGTVFFGLEAKGAGFSNIIAVRQIFASDLGLLVGWTHYLVFDLFIGAWEARDAARRHIPHFILIPCLLLTFIFGPVGLCLYLVLRRTSKKAGAALDETGTL